MLIDVLSSNDTVSFNVKLAQIFGLKGAVYCSELLNIIKKAHNKNKLVEGGYVKVDRNYISKRTTVTPSEQLDIDNYWVKNNFITKLNENTLKLDEKLLLSILADEEVDVATLRETFAIKDKETNSRLKRASICEGIKNSFRCSDEDVLKALRDWVDTIYENPKGFLSKASARIAEDTLLNYTKDKDVQLKLINIATVNGYKDIQFAINNYERGITMKNNNTPRVTKQQTSVELDRTTIF